MTTGKQYSPKFKARVAVEALRGKRRWANWVRSSKFIPCRLPNGGRPPWINSPNCSWTDEPERGLMRKVARMHCMKKSAV